MDRRGPEAQLATREFAVEIERHRSLRDAGGPAIRSSYALPGALFFADAARVATPLDGGRAPRASCAPTQLRGGADDGHQDRHRRAQGDTRMTGIWIDISAGFRGYLAVSQCGSGPGLLLLQEIFGINPHMRA